MINWKLDLRLLSFIVLFIGLLMGIPTALAFNYQETDAVMGFLAAYAAIAVFCTTILISTGKSQDKQMLARDGYLVVTLTWVIATAFSAIPLVAS
ncbi:MAG: TrkH family potassium uptake protein, partial [Sphaerochaeta sp.]